MSAPSTIPTPTRFDETIGGMLPRPDGEWIRSEDYELAERVLRIALAALEKIKTIDNHIAQARLGAKHALSEIQSLTP